MQGILSKIETREWLISENCDQQIFGVLHRPVGSDNPPLTIIMHGFASSKHGSNRCYVRMAEALAAGGIAALRFDFRGSGDSEGSLSEICFDDLVSDAVAVCNYAKGLDRIDASKIGIFGASLGGSIGILASQLYEKIKTLVLWAPVANGKLWFRDFLRQHPELASKDPSEAMGKYRGIDLHPKFKEQFGRMDAAAALEGLAHIPVLHLHGEKDSVISIDHQALFKQASRHPGSRFVRYPETEHRLGFAPVFPQVIEEVKAWFLEHLK